MIQVDLNDRRHLHAAQVILQRIQIEKRRPNIPHHRYASPLPSTPPPPPAGPAPCETRGRRGGNDHDVGGGSRGHAAVESEAHGDAVGGSGME